MSEATFRRADCNGKQNHPSYDRKTCGWPERCKYGVVFSLRQGNFTFMEVFEAVQCPYCGQTFDIVVDTSVASQTFTTDCEICCRPFEVVAESSPGEILSLDVREN